MFSKVNVYMCGQHFLSWLSFMFSFVRCDSRNQDSSLLPDSIIFTVSSIIICYRIYFPWGRCWEFISPSLFLHHSPTAQRSFNYSRCFKCITLTGSRESHSRNITLLHLWSQSSFAFVAQGSSQTQHKPSLPCRLSCPFIVEEADVNLLHWSFKNLIMNMSMSAFILKEISWWGYWFTLRNGFLILEFYSVKGRKEAHMLGEFCHSSLCPDIKQKQPLPMSSVTLSSRWWLIF